MAMDNLLVDLDKVLDDFEAEEKAATLAPGQEVRPSGFSDFLEKHDERPWKILSEAPANQPVQFQHEDQALVAGSVMYDIPYEPTEKFDLSEADFAPSPTPADKSLNRSFIYEYEKDVTSSLSPAHQVYKAEVSEKNLQNQSLSELSNAKTYISEPGHALRYPVQAADNSPEAVSNSTVFQVNGHAGVSEPTQVSPIYHKNKNVVNHDVPAEQPGKIDSALNQLTTNSTTSGDESHDKFPVQCNTPQTPNDNPNVNPLDIQIAQSQTMHSSPDIKTTDVRSMVLNGNESTVSNAGESSQSPVHSGSDDHREVLHTITPPNATSRSIGGFLQSGSDIGAFSSLPVVKQTEETPGFASLPNFADNSKPDLVQNNLEYQNTRNTDMRFDSNETLQTTRDTANSLSSQQTLPSITSDSSITELKTVAATQAVVGFGDMEIEVDEKDLVDYLEDEASEDTQSSFATADTAENRVAKISTGEVASFPPEERFVSGEENSEDGTPKKLSSVSEVTDMSNSGVSTANVGTQAVTNPVEMIQVIAPAHISGQQYDSTDLEILNVLPTDDVIGRQQQNFSETLSNDSRELLNSQLEQMLNTADSGARPKESQSKINRPNTLMGLSKVDLNSESPFLAQSPKEPMVSEQVVGDVCYNDTVNTVETSSKIHQLTNDYPVNQPADLKDYLQHPPQQIDYIDPAISNQTSQNIPSPHNKSNSKELLLGPDSDSQEPGSPSKELEDMEDVMMRPHSEQEALGGSATRPHSWSPSGSDQSAMQKQKRPTSLNLPPRPEFNPGNDNSPPDYQASPEEAGASGHTGAVLEETETSTGGIETPPGEELTGAEGPQVPELAIHDNQPPPPYSTSLGKFAPKWIPDGEAPTCMSCEARFTFTKRRHHCRACGKVFCSVCCSMKSKLFYMDNKEARVCMTCHQEIAAAEFTSEAWSAGRSPYPTNPSDYCSTVPPTQQANCPTPPPSVLVPVGVLKREGTSKRGEPKQVMFSDGIRPGGDLTELDGSSEVNRMTPRRSGRSQKRVERSQEGQHQSRGRRLRTIENRAGKCLIPEDGLPPLASSAQSGMGFALQENPDQATLVQQIKDEASPPVMFAVNANLYVLVKILNLDCCVNRVVWCFTSRGMTSVGQEEVVIALEVIPGEDTIPRDILCHINTLYEEACKGNSVTDMGHSIFSHSFLGSREHGGFLYMRATFQCVQKLILPSPPFIFGILLQKWETPWAKVFPIRLLLRLGAEYRYYPCPLIGVRNRKPVFFEIGHTIMNLLADFRNYQYMLPQIRGITIHMEDKKNRINFPKNRYDELMKVVSNSNEHVMAMGANFSPEADSHLVCIQNDDGNYQTQAINIQNKPRKVTGASFVVFNGALKTSSGLSAKSSIVEDGLMVQITPDSMLALKQAMKDMQDYTICCGSLTAPKPEETVLVQWVDEDKNVNVGVKSPIDRMPMDGIESVHIHHSTDYVGEKSVIRWTEVFFIQNEDNGSAKWDPMDLSRLGETLATACCIALTPHLEKLKETMLTKIGLRVTIEMENVGYEAGAKGERLPDIYMNDLDNELIPVIHRATQQSHEGPIVLELIFQILDIYPYV